MSRSANNSHRHAAARRRGAGGRGAGGRARPRGRKPAGVQGARHSVWLRPMVVLCLAGLIGIWFTLPKPSAADVYSWTDADGVVHFTNQRPRGSKWKKVMDSAPPPGSKAAAQRGGCPRCDKVTSHDNSPERFHRYDAFIYEAAELYRIPVALIRAVIRVESDYDPAVVSAFDAKGLMQLMPSVVDDMGVPAEAVFDPRINILGGTKLLRTLANRYNGSLELTIAGYHAGPGSLAKFGNTVPPYPYTQQYLRMVLQRYREYVAQEAAGAPLTGSR